MGSPEAGRKIHRHLLRLLLAQENVILGGQAVLEGVMMRSPRAFAVAVRRPDGGISLLGEELAAWTARWRFLRLPFVRGAVTLVQSLALGIRALNFSSEEAYPEEHKPAGENRKSPWTVPLTLIMALALAAGLFFLLPLGLTELVRHFFPGLGEGLAFNATDGLFRAAIFFAYLLAISRLPDIKRLFRYHGAEHKVVHAFEAKGPMDVPTVQRFATSHPRCGTSFLLFVLVVAMAVFSLIPGAWGAGTRLGARVLLIPLIAGAAYELIRFSARHLQSGWGRLLVAPGLWLQKITTGPPDDAMVEVALAAYSRAAAIEGGEVAAL